MYSQKALHAVKWDGENLKDIDTFCQTCGYHYVNLTNMAKTIVMESNDYKHIVTLRLNEVLYFKGNNHKLHTMTEEEFTNIHLRED